jgi:hypothetical protein
LTSLFRIEIPKRFHRRKIETREEAKREIIKYTEVFYNRPGRAGRAAQAGPRRPGRAGSVASLGVGSYPQSLLTKPTTENKDRRNEYFGVHE